MDVIVKLDVEIETDTTTDDAESYPMTHLGSAQVHLGHISRTKCILNDQREYYEHNIIKTLRLF